jgi:hypothetical protein
LTRKLIGKADVEAGAFFALFGAVTAVLSLQYGIGTAAEMGPGYFPLTMGVLLTIIGSMILINGLVSYAEESSNLNLNSMTVVAVSLIAFAVLIVNAGLIFAVPVLVFVSLLASDHFSIRRAFILSASLLLFCYLVFVRFLGVAVPMIAESTSWTF